MDSILVSFHAQRTKALLLMPSRRDIETCWRQKEVTMTMLNILAIYESKHLIIKALVSICVKNVSYFFSLDDA
jgi:hypothetical protein